MQSENFRALVKPIATVHRVIWLAFIGAVPIYVVVAYLQPGRIEQSVTHPMPTSFTISLVMLSLLAPYMPRLLLPDSRLRQIIDQPQETLARDPRTGIVDEDRLTRIRTLSPDERRLFALVVAHFVPFLVRLAFNESIALFGLVLSLLSRSFVAVLPFAIVSLALNWRVPLPLDEALKRTASVGPHDEMPIHPR
jgi:hypothetical protein